MPGRRDNTCRRGLCGAPPIGAGDKLCVDHRAAVVAITRWVDPSTFPPRTAPKPHAEGPRVAAPPVSAIDAEADALALSRAVHRLATAAGRPVSRNAARLEAGLPNSPRIAAAARLARVERGWINLVAGPGGGYEAGATPLPD